MINGHKIKSLEDVPKFMERIRGYSYKDIECTPHTFFRLGQKQRELFKCEQIKQYILEETPIFAGVQNNGNFTAFYKYKDQKYIRIIIDIKSDKINVVTFYVLEKTQMPAVRK